MRALNRIIGMLTSSVIARNISGAKNYFPPLLLTLSLSGGALAHTQNFSVRTPSSSAITDYHAAALTDAWSSFELLPSLLLLASAAIYFCGLRRLWPRVARGRHVLRQRALMFGGGWLMLAATLSSPLHAAGSRSFSLHMIEHEIIMLMIAPLLALSQPFATMIWALPPAWRRAIARGVNHRAIKMPWRWLSRLSTATAVQIAVLWLWHAPVLFDFALRSEAWHIAQHISFLMSALLFWWSLAHDRDSERPTAAAYLFITALATGFLGAAMAFSASPWYAPYAAMRMMPFALTPVEDQQLAGLFMWIPGGLVHTLVAILLLARWLETGRAAKSNVPANAEKFSLDGGIITGYRNP